MVSGIVMSPCFCGTSLPSSTNPPSVSNGCVPVWNCGIVIEPLSRQKPS